MFGSRKSLSRKVATQTRAAEAKDPRVQARRAAKATPTALTVQRQQAAAERRARG